MYTNNTCNYVMPKKKSPFKKPENKYVLFITHSKNNTKNGEEKNKVLKQRKQGWREKQTRCKN